MSEQTVYLIPFSPPLLKCTIKSNYIYCLFATLSYFLGIVITYVIRKYLMLQIHVTDKIKPTASRDTHLFVFLFENRENPNTIQ